ncbi:MAG: zf-HC2 domain-containing protein [Gemmataceae bacterium]|nr:zf-HC2 domain-containing protein [Gemmataceae bacterium]
MSPGEPAFACAWALETILEGHDRPPDAESARRLRDHLERCPDCRKIEACERRLTRVLAGIPLPPTPADFHHRVRALVRRQRLRRRLAAGAALVVAAVLVAFLSLGATPRPAGRPGSQSPVVGVASPEVERFLAAAPPVEALEVLDRQQQAYLTVLEELEAGQ